MGLNFEQNRELERAMETINACVRRGAMIRLVDKKNPQFSIKIDREMDIIVADLLTMSANYITNR